jgi:hypothetical protein
VAVWVVDAAAKRLEIRAVAGGLSDFPRRPLDVGAGDVGWVAAERRQLEVADIAADPRVADPEWWRQSGLRSFLGVPIVFQDLLLGVLVLGGREAFRFSLDDRELLEIFVSQAAAAIAKARLFQDIQDRASSPGSLRADPGDGPLDGPAGASGDSRLRQPRPADLSTWLSEDDGAALPLIAGGDTSPTWALIPLRGSGASRRVGLGHHAHGGQRRAARAGAAAAP